MNELIEIQEEKKALSTESAEQMLAFVENCMKKMEIMAITIQSMSAKIDDLQKQMRWAVPMTAAQVKKINECIRRRATELLTKYEGSAAPETVKALCTEIRRGVKQAYGVGSLKEIPKSEYAGACNAASRWLDIYAYKRAINNAGTKHEGGRQ